ncbi:Ribonuclease P/MRP protein subunit POP5 [Taenia solium]|eukprot:TsM_000529700 transcript=TsM_000529700 gene=TsM_000529700
MGGSQGLLDHISVMVRVKYRYLISVVSVGASSGGGASRSVSHRPAYPGCHAIASVSSYSSTDDAMIYKAIKRSVQTAHGTFGVGRLMARFRIIYWNPFSGLLIIRVLRGLPTEQLTSALSLITSVYDGAVERPAVIDVIHRSGTVRCCQKFIVDYYRTQLSGAILGVQETAIARAVANRLIEAKPPDLTFDFK